MSGPIETDVAIIGAGPIGLFAVFELGPEKRWWQGTAINPYPLLAGKPVSG